MMASTGSEYLRATNLRVVLGAGLTIVVAILTGTAAAVLPWSSMVLAIHVLLFILFLRRPAWSVYTLIFIVPVTQRVLFIEDRSMSNLIVGTENLVVSPVYPLLIVLAGLAVFIINRAKQRSPSLVESHLLIPLSVILVVSFVTLFKAPDIDHSLIQYSLLVTNFLLFYVIISSIQTVRELRQATWCIVISGVIQSILGLILISLKYGLVTFSLDLDMGYSLNLSLYTDLVNKKGLFRGLNGTQEAHRTALMLAATFPMIIGLFIIEKKSALRKFLVIAAVIVLTAEIMTLVRGGVIGIYIASLFSFLVLSKLRPRFVVLAASLGFGIVFLIYATTFVCNYLNQTDVEPRIIAQVTGSGGSRISASSSVKQLETRRGLWSESFQDLREMPVLGMGLGNLKLFEKAPHAHSIYFSYILDFGMFGVFVLLWFGFTLANRYMMLPWTQSTHSQVLGVAAMGGVLAVLIHGMVDFEYNTTLVWLYLGFAVAASNLLYRERIMDTESVKNVHKVAFIRN